MTSLVETPALHRPALRFLKMASLAGLQDAWMIAQSAIGGRDNGGHLQERTGENVLKPKEEQSKTI